MRQFWDQLTNGQKQTVTAGLIFVGAVLLVQFAVVPYFEARQNVSRAIAASEKVLREVAVLGAEYGVRRQRFEEIRRVIERRTPSFALLSYLEKRASDAGVKGNIRSMNLLPSVSTAGEYRGDETG
jgi:general secretion pathway protein M